MIRTVEIPKEQWSSFIQRLDRHIGERPFRVEVVGRALGDQEMERLLPFHGLDYDSKGSEAGSLTITGGTDGGEATHRIIGPTRLYMAINDAAEIEWLAIEEVGEVGPAQTLIHFEHLPELPPPEEQPAAP